MADIIDYALLNAHKDFDTLPYNKVDGLVFSQLAYLSYDYIVPSIKEDGDGLLLSDVAESNDYEAIFPLERTAERNKKLLNAVAYSKRYGQIKVNFYEDIFDPLKETQFCAITFILPNGDACIAFRGTDSTITGWKENFNMLFTSPVSAQTHSVPYVDEVAKKIKGNIILTGHSKGGNLAIYAGTKCSQFAKDKIVEIQAFDSPGFTKEFIESQEHIETEKKIVKFIPEESLIGVLLNNRENYSIIKSEGSGIMQHDPFMWQVENGDFVQGEKLYLKSQFFDATFNDLVTNSDPVQKEQFIEALFSIINETNIDNATSFVDWSENLKENSSIVYETLKDLDVETRNLVLKGFGNIFSTINKNVKSTPKKLWADAVKKFKEKTAQENLTEE